MDIYDIVGSGLTAQRLRLDTVSSNIANIQTTRAEDGTLKPYKRHQVVFAPYLADATANEAPGGLSETDRQADGRLLLKGFISDRGPQPAGVQVVQIAEDDKTPMQKIYDPAHPDADASGYVTLPNVNVVTEMVDMIAASRAYEAGVTTLHNAKAMDESALQI